MVRLSKRLLDSLPKIRPPKSQKETAVQDIAYQRKVRKKRSWIAKRADSSLERTPKADTYIQKPKQEKPVNKSKTETKNRLGDFLIRKNRILAESYKDDLDAIALQIPEVTFFREANNTSTKELKSILDKIQKRAEQFEERGYNGVIRDGVRATIFMPHADKNYMKIVAAMEKKGYKVAKNFAEDAEGKLILDANGKPKMVDDIDVRFGKNACQSGYEDVQLRFQRGDVLYELIILPGPHYMSTKNKEHEIYDQFKRYKILGFEKDFGAKQIVNGIKEKFAGITRLWYASAAQRDLKGAAVETPTFSKEDIKDLNGLFKSLKNLFLGKFETLPPSKRTHSEFKQTKTFYNLHDIEINLRKVMEMFKPIEEKSPTVIK